MILCSKRQEFICKDCNFRCFNGVLIHRLKLTSDIEIDICKFRFYNMSEKMGICNDCWTKKYSHQWWL
jgi:hypothetical protein